MAQYYISTGWSDVILSSRNDPTLAHIWDDNDVLYWFNSNYPVLLVYNTPRVVPVLRPHLHAITGISSLAKYSNHYMYSTAPVIIFDFYLEFPIFIS